MAVTMKIRRETRVAQERAAAERAAAQSGELQVPPPVPGTRPESPVQAEAHVAVPSASVPAKPVDAETAYRRARLGVVAVVALVLLLAWIVQRRSTLKSR